MSKNLQILRILLAYVCHFQYLHQLVLLVFSINIFSNETKDLFLNLNEHQSTINLIEIISSSFDNILDDK